MNIKDILKQTAENLVVDQSTGHHVFMSTYYGNDFEANARATDDALYPMCQIVPPLASSSVISPRTGRFTDSFSQFVFFCDIQPKGMDAIAEENDLIISRMREAAKRYVHNLVKTGSFDVVQKVEFKHLFFKYDSVVCGVLAFFTLKDKTGLIYCD